MVEGPSGLNRLIPLTYVWGIKVSITVHFHNVNKLLTVSFQTKQIFAAEKLRYNVFALDATVDRTVDKNTVEMVQKMLCSLMCPFSFSIMMAGVGTT